MDQSSYKSVDREKKRLQSSFRHWLKWNGPGTAVIDYIGTDIGNVREWIESNWIEGMNWENYGQIWVVDHIVPIRFFNVFNSEDMALCWHYKNLMPLFKKDNEKKQGNIFFSYEILTQLKDTDYFFTKLLDRISEEVQWMNNYISVYHEKYSYKKPHMEM